MPFRPLKRFFGFLLILPILASAQTPPDTFLGHKVGEDRKLADYRSQ
jgi:hypothetical protein